MLAEHTQWDEIEFEESLHFKATFRCQLQSLGQNGSIVPFRPDASVLLRLLRGTQKSRAASKRSTSGGKRRVPVWFVQGGLLCPAGRRLRPMHPGSVSEEDLATLWRTLEEWKHRA